jgi:hypothetical protein
VQAVADGLPQLLAQLPWWSIPIVVAIVYLSGLPVLPALLHLHLGKVDVPLASPSLVPILAAIPAAVVALAGLAGQGMHPTLPPVTWNLYATSRLY